MPRQKTTTDDSILRLFSAVNIKSSTPVFIQIRNLVMFGIAAEHLRPSDQLPSVRELSEQLDVNPNTVAKSYRDLEIMRIVTTRRGMGVFVAPNGPKKCQSLCQEKVIRRTYEIIQEGIATGLTPVTIKQYVSESLKFETGPYVPTPPALLKK